MLIYQPRFYLHRTGMFPVCEPEWEKDRHRPFRLAKYSDHCLGLALRMRTPTYLSLNQMQRIDLCPASLSRRP